MMRSACASPSACDLLPRMVGISRAAISAMLRPASSGPMRAAMNWSTNSRLPPPKDGLVKQSTRP